MTQDTPLKTKGEALRDYLRDNIEDPIKRMGQWIHYDTLESGLESVKTGKTPSIFIERVPSSEGFQSAGTAERLDNLVFDIHVVIRMNDCGTVNNFQYKRTFLLDKIIEIVDKQLLTNATSISGINWLNRISLGGNLKTGLYRISTSRYILQ